MTAQIILRILHIIGGICWVGAAVFNALFLLPAVRAIGPAAAAIMREIAEVRKLHVFFAIASWVTILSGVALAWRDTGTEGFAWFQHGVGAVFGFGAIAAILGLIVGLAVSAPTAVRMTKISAQVASAGRAPTPDELRTLGAAQDKMLSAARWGAALLLIASAAMATARYV